MANGNGFGTRIIAGAKATGAYLKKSAQVAFAYLKPKAIAFGRYIRRKWPVFIAYVKSRTKAAIAAWKRRKGNPVTNANNNDRTMPMAWPLAKVIAIAVYGIPAFILGIIGWVSTSSIETAGDIVLLWSAVYVVWNMAIIPQQEFRVIERAGQFYQVKLRNRWFLFRFYCARGIIDRDYLVGTIKYRTVAIFRDHHKKNEEYPNGCPEVMDFPDDSVGIDAHMSYRIGNPAAGIHQLKEDIVNYAYRFDDPDARAIKVVEDIVRPDLQKHKVDYANEHREEIVHLNEDLISAGLTPMGIYLQPIEPSILISDFIFSAESIAIRRRLLESEKVKDETVQKAQGWRDAIKAIQEKEGGEGNCTWVEAQAIFERQQYLEAYAKSGAHVTFISPDAGSLMKTLDVATKH